MPDDEIKDGSDWRGQIPDEVKGDTKLAPIIANMKEPNMKAFITTAINAQHRLGSALSIPGKDAKDTDKATFRGKLYDAEFLPRPVETPEAYGDLRPESIPEGYAWNDTVAKDFRTLLHKHGASKEMAKDLMAMYENLTVAGSKAMITSRQESETALKTEYGEKYPERAEMVKRMVPLIFKSPEDLAFFEETGMGDHPGFLSVLMRLAPLAMQDESFMAGAGTGAGGIDAQKELASIMTDPKNPRYELYRKADPATMEYVAGLYKRQYGDKTVEVG